MWSALILQDSRIPSIQQLAAAMKQVGLTSILNVLLVGSSVVLPLVSQIQRIQPLKAVVEVENESWPELIRLAFQILGTRHLAAEMRQVELISNLNLLQVDVPAS